MEEQQELKKQLQKDKENLINLHKPNKEKLTTALFRIDNNNKDLEENIEK